MKNLELHNHIKGTIKYSVVEINSDNFTGIASYPVSQVQKVLDMQPYESVDNLDLPTCIKVATILNGSNDGCFYGVAEQKLNVYRVS